MSLSELRAAITRAREAGERDKLAELQGQYRSLPLDLRREVLSGERVDERAGRRVVRTCSVPGSAPAVSRATPATDPVAAAGPTLFGHFAVFNVWSEIESFWEGNFMEQLAQGAFVKTFENDRANMRITLNHGRDPLLGNKVLAHPIRELREDKIGAYYEAALLDGIDPLVMSGLQADAYGASFRFYVMAENFVDKPTPSASNPRGLPERTITEAMVEEFGPVTFPQYPEASAHLRSRTTSRSIATPAAAGTQRREHAPMRRDEWIRSI